MRSHLLYNMAAVALVLTEIAAGALPGGGSDMLKQSRLAMVKEQIEARGVEDRRVLAALRAVPRHEFVPPHLRAHAYEDHPLEIGWGQTISQPYIVALMTELAELEVGAKVLEVGTGSGYQAAVLAEMGADVYTIEIIPDLAEHASETLERLGYAKVSVRTGDGYLGWPDQAPFDGILVTAAPEDVPEPLIEQLRVGGRLVIPLGSFPDQVLTVVHKTGSGLRREEVTPVRFVPMTGIAADT